jgi:hypothetical protein
MDQLNKIVERAEIISIAFKDKIAYQIFIKQKDPPTLGKKKTIINKHSIRAIL